MPKPRPQRRSQQSRPGPPCGPQRGSGSSRQSSASKPRPNPFADLGVAEPLPVPAWFGGACEELGIALEAVEVRRLGSYLAALYAGNERANLTAVRDVEEGWRKHVLDSLTLLPVVMEVAAAVEEAGGGRVRLVDVGSGAGLPAVPLAVCLPDVDVVAVESTGKKARFIEAVVARLGLGNVAVVAERAEVVGRDSARRAGYDVVVARAVGRLAVIAELTVPLARVGGVVVLVKGERASEELAEGKAALHLLHAHHERTIRTPTGSLVVLSKPRATPGKYPRPTGEPKRKPLGLE